MGKTLDILTTQNVTIEYGLASIADRIFAFILDGIVLILLYFIIYFGFNWIVNGNYYSDNFMYAYFVVFVFYSLLLEYFRNGQSFGKQIMGIKVAKINGSEYRFSDCVARWCFRIVDIYLSAGTIAMFMINSTVRAQRLGDIVANTAVIRIRPNYSPNLNNILNIRSIDDYQPQFYQVTQMKEEEMMEIKSILQEVINHPNNAHLKQLSELRKILSNRLRIGESNLNDRAFIQQLINDYIVLTR